MKMYQIGLYILIILPLLLSLLGALAIGSSVSLLLSSVQQRPAASGLLADQASPTNVYKNTGKTHVSTTYSNRIFDIIDPNN